MSPGEWIALGALVLTCVSTLGGLLAWYFNQQLRRVDTQIEGLWNRFGEVQAALRRHELDVAERYVRHEHLEAMERRILSRFDKLESAIDRALGRIEGGQQ